MKKLLREIEISACSVLHEDKAKRTMTIVAPWAQAGVMNKNQRIYPQALLQREIARVQGQVESGQMVCAADHPATGYTNIESASHIVRKLWLDKSGTAWTELKILPTPKGLTIQTIIENGGKLGLSSRGFGTVDHRTRVVQDDYSLQGLDIVCNPSCDIAEFSSENIFESEDFTQAQTKITGIADKRTFMQILYNRDVDQGLFRGSFEEWKQTNEFFVDVAIAETTENLTYEQALEKVAGAEKAEEILRKERRIQPKIVAKDVYLEAMIAGVSPSEYAKKINAEVDKQNANIFDNDEEAQALISEAHQAGLNTADPKVRQKILEDAFQRKINTPPALTETEKAKKAVKEAEQKEREKYSFLAGERILAGQKK